MSSSTADVAASTVAESTTLMFRYMPRKFVVKDMLKQLEWHVSRTHIDFVYVPWQRDAANNKGYAFVNFVDAQSAQAAFTSMQGTVWHSDPRMREIRIVPAAVQGLVANLQRYIDSEPDSVHRPVVFSHGQAIPLRVAVQRFCPDSMALQNFAAGDDWGNAATYTSAGSDSEMNSAPRQPMSREHSGSNNSGSFGHSSTSGASPHMALGAGVGDETLSLASTCDSTVNFAAAGATLGDIVAHIGRPTTPLEDLMARHGQGNTSVPARLPFAGFAKNRAQAESSRECQWSDLGAPSYVTDVCSLPPGLTRMSSMESRAYMQTENFYESLAVDANTGGVNHFSF